MVALVLRGIEWALQARRSSSSLLNRLYKNSFEVVAEEYFSSLIKDLMVALIPFAPDIGRSFMPVVGTSQAHDVMWHFQLVFRSSPWFLGTVDGLISAYGEG